MTETIARGRAAPARRGRAAPARRDRRGGGDRRRRGDRGAAPPRGIGAVGSADARPAGEFYVRNKLTRYRSPAYGPVAFGTRAQSPTLTDRPAGGFVGIHGTDRPDLLPGRVSHGCIRIRNADVLRLEHLKPVGTPLTIA